MDLTGHVGVAANPSHLNVALKCFRCVHEGLALVQTLLKSRSHEQVVFSEIDNFGDLLAVLVPGCVEHTSITGEVVSDLCLEIVPDVHGLGCVVCGHKLEQLDEQSSGVMRILQTVLLDEVPQSI